MGCLCDDLPDFVKDPPVEAVVFGWGVAEDGQLVRVAAALTSHHWGLRAAFGNPKHGLGAVSVCAIGPVLPRRVSMYNRPSLLQGVDTEAPVLSPKVVEALLGTRLRGREFGKGPLVSSQWAC